MESQIKTEKIYVYSFIDLSLQWNAQIFKFESAFKNQKCALKNPKNSLLLLAAPCPSLRVGRAQSCIHFVLIKLFVILA